MTHEQTEVSPASFLCSVAHDCLIVLKTEEGVKEKHVFLGIEVRDAEIHVGRGIEVHDAEVHVGPGTVVRDCPANVEDQAEHWLKHYKMLSKQVK